MTALGRTLVKWFLVVCSAAFVVAVHAAPAALTADEARHLLGRSGFAPTPAEVAAITGQPAGRVVARLVADAQQARPGQRPPAFVSDPPPVPGNLLKTREEQAAVREQQFREGLELKTWWMREMLTSPAPLAERMTLFWHNHFATSQQKVVRSQAMWVQHQTLRTHALGDFRTLLHAMARDPAMLVYLDGANSRKDAPNENFAREVMELFTLGEATQAAQGLGGYTEQDIREAARAFTGWSVDRRDFTLSQPSGVPRPRKQDDLWPHGTVRRRRGARPAAGPARDSAVCGGQTLEGVCLTSAVRRGRAARV